MVLIYGLQDSPKRSIPEHFVSMSNDPLKLHLEALYLEEIGWKDLRQGTVQKKGANANEVFSNHFFSV